jgi:peptidoglycan/LPS O-acetylase OafA/YrhL
MVFTWHFVHTGSVLPPEYVPAIFPLSLLDEGHTGVALFMALSGYLFAKLLDGRRIDYRAFIWNRFIRLFPLLALVILVLACKKLLAGDDFWGYANSILWGPVKPTLPHGGWSITVEAHFYLILPLLLWVSRKSEYSLLLVVCATIVLRVVLYQVFGQIQDLAYSTIIGRLDQFLCGMMAYRLRHAIGGRHLLALVIIVSLAAFYWFFDGRGGFAGSSADPLLRRLWLIIPTMEGIAYAVAISWYDNSFSHSNGRMSQILALFGQYSYSIYLLHFFVVGRLATAIHEHLLDLSDFHVALGAAFVCFLGMLPIGYLSFRFVEAPFLSLRTRYVIAEPMPSRAHDSPGGTSQEPA